MIACNTIKVNPIPPNWLPIIALLGHANCLSLEPNFITPHFSGDGIESDSQSVHVDTSLSNTDTSSIEDPTGDSTGTTLTSTSSDAENSDSENSATSEDTSSDGSTSGIDLTTGTTDSTDTTESSDTAGSTTDSTTDTSEETATSGNTTDTGSTSEDTGSDLCVPHLCMAANENASTDNTRWALSSNIYATSLEPNATQFIARVEIASGKVSGTLKLELWSNNSSTQRPERMLVGNHTALQLPVSWQGVDFFPNYQVDAGEKYWLVWSLPQNAQAPLAQFGQLVPSAWSSNNGAQWNLDNSPIMYRIYCCDSPY